MLTGRFLLKDGVRAFPHHVVDGLHDVQHLLNSFQQQQLFSFMNNFLRIIEKNYIFFPAEPNTWKTDTKSLPLRQMFSLKASPDQQGHCWLAMLAARLSG